MQFIPSSINNTNTNNNENNNTTTTTYKKLLLIPFACIISSLILIVGHSPPLHTGASALVNGKLPVPNPLSCNIGTCWDFANKYGFHPCTMGSGQKVRGVVVEQGQITCYRSIIINLESNTALALLVIAFYIVFTSRIAEHLFDVMLFQRKLRWSVFIAICFSLFPWFYSFTTVFIYINEFRPTMLSSQLYFTLSEIFVVFVLVAHSSRDYININLLLVGCGTAFSHLLQNLMDEFFGNTEPNHLRNIFLGAGDVAGMICIFHILRTSSSSSSSSSNSLNLSKENSIQQVWKRRIRIVLYVALIEMICFQILFADSASFSFLN
jgi:hypothetical protein